jgi:hypothetical protein
MNLKKESNKNSILRKELEDEILKIIIKKQKRKKNDMT